LNLARKRKIRVTKIQKCKLNFIFETKQKIEKFIWLRNFLLVKMNLATMTKTITLVGRKATKTTGPTTTMEVKGSTRLAMTTPRNGAMSTVMDT
jgi:hypothetical protein